MPNACNHVRPVLGLLYLVCMLTTASKFHVASCSRRRMRRGYICWTSEPPSCTAETSCRRRCATLSCIASGRRPNAGALVRICPSDHSSIHPSIHSLHTMSAIQTCVHSLVCMVWLNAAASLPCGRGFHPACTVVKTLNSQVVLDGMTFIGKSLV